MKSFFRRSFAEVLICLTLATMTFGFYSQVLNFEFVHYDDNDYVLDNPAVQKGLTRENLIWAFTTSHASNWHLITWLSHLTDVSLLGMAPGLHHLTNLLFHIANSLLMFSVFRIMTGKLWQSAFVAAMFALHPLRVQSVAWVSECKDVLSAFFWLLTMGTYFFYLKKPGIFRYISVFFVFALGLMSKSMLVTLPFVLLLMDYWPLSRFKGLSNSSDARPVRFYAEHKHLIIEKIPLLTLAILSSVITFFVQYQAGSIKSLDVIPRVNRLVNTPIAYMQYMLKMIYPSKMACFYPYPKLFSQIPLFFLSTILIIITSFLVMRLKAKAPYLIVGWLWFLGTLIPVIGLVQIGAQSMADRYTYIPLTGLFIMIAWGLPELITNRWKYKKFFLASTAAIVLCIFSMLTCKQTATWENSVALFSHAFAVNPDNYLAHKNLGGVLDKKGETTAATSHYRRSLEINPFLPDVHAALVLWGENSVTYFHAASFSLSSNLDSKFFNSLRVNFHSKGRDTFSYSA